MGYACEEEINLKRHVWLIWQVQVEKIDHLMIQLQELRVIASSEKKANIYKSIFKREVKEGDLKGEFVIEKREINHMLGWQDLNRFICRRD